VVGVEYENADPSMSVDLVDLPTLRFDKAQYVETIQGGVDRVAA
jgi:hypothetical protein